MNNYSTGAVNFASTPDELIPVVTDIVNSGKGDTAIAFTAELYNHVKDQTFEVPYVVALDLFQEFETKIGDMIQLEIMVEEDTFNTINDSYKDMICKLRGYLYDPTSGDTYGEIISIDWMIIIANRSNASKFVLPKQEAGDSGEVLTKNRMLSLTLNLYNPGILRMKTRKSSGIFRDSTLANYIGFVSSVFGAKIVDLTPPDNTTVIENLVIEPMHYMADIFDYLQDRYGIYLHGVSVYYTGLNDDDSCLYVYPKYQTHPTLKEDDAAEIIFIGENNVPNGWMNFRQYPEDSKIIYDGKETSVSGTKILCGKINTTIPFSEVGADAVGTMSIMFNANRTIDRWRSIKVDGKNLAVPVHNADIIDGMKVTKDFLGFATAQYNPRYDISDNNPYKVNEKLAAVNSELIVLTCTGMFPWLLKPGQLIMFTYSRDTMSGLSKLYGIAHSVHYSFIQVNSVDKSKRAFQCNAEIVLRISPEA